MRRLCHGEAGQAAREPMAAGSELCLTHGIRQGALMAAHLTSVPSVCGLVKILLSLKNIWKHRLQFADMFRYIVVFIFAF